MREVSNGHMRTAQIVVCGCVFALACLWTCCGGGENPPPISDGRAGARIANPASTHCVENNGKLEIREGEKGQYGVCIFEDGSRCEEWSFLRSECARGECREESGMCGH
jgi:putative hemolysin